MGFFICFKNQTKSIITKKDAFGKIVPIQSEIKMEVIKKTALLGTMTTIGMVIATVVVVATAMVLANNDGGER